MRALITLTLVVSAALISASAQLGPSTDLPEGPQVFNEAGQQFRVVPIHGLEQPWALAACMSTRHASRRGNPRGGSPASASSR